jgi:hypothetical protein
VTPEFLIPDYCDCDGDRRIEFKRDRAIHATNPNRVSRAADPERTEQCPSQRYSAVAQNLLMIELDDSMFDCSPVAVKADGIIVADERVPNLKEAGTQ